MDLSNFIDNKKQSQFDGQFNSANLNFQNVLEQDLVSLDNKKYFNVDQFEQKKKKNQMYKDMFSLLALTDNAVDIVRALKKKYGNTLIDQSVVAACVKLSDIIGNYVITCKYNDDFGNKNPTFIKYVMFCDCQDDEVCEQQIGAGSVDGFFQKSKKVKLAKNKICKKHNLPVLAKLQDLTEQDFKQLAKKVAQVKSITVNNESKKSVASKISNVFSKIANKNKVKVANNVDYSVKDANVQLVATVSEQIKDACVDQIVTPVQGDFDTVDYSDITVDTLTTPKQEMFTVVDQQDLNSDVNMPINNICVEVKQQNKSINPFSVNVLPYDQLQLVDNGDVSVCVQTRDMNFDVENKCKKMNNISLKTKTLDHGIGMKDDFDFVLNEDVCDNITVDTQNSFDF